MGLDQRIAEAARLAGGKDICRIVTLARTAVILGDKVQSTIETLSRTCPELFYTRANELPNENRRRKTKGTSRRERERQTDGCCPCRLE